MIHHYRYIKIAILIVSILFPNLYLMNSEAFDQGYIEYESQPLAFSLLEVSYQKWVGNNGYAKLADNSTIPFARIIDPDKKNVSDLTEACAIGLYISPRQENSINIDNIIIIVDSYEPLPQNISLESTLAYASANIFYAEIDDPKICHEKQFEANPVINGDVIENGFVLGTAYLTRDKPESFIIRINAKTPGIYTFSCMILARYNDIKQRIMVVGDKDKLFKFVFI